MPATADTLQVEGLRDLSRAFKLADAQLNRELRTRLRDAAEPVRSTAERMAAAGIPRVGIAWSRMRVGVTTHSVYVAPRQRGGRDIRRRPNFAGLLLDRAMLPALEQNAPKVIRDMDDLLGDVGRTWERV